MGPQVHKDIKEVMEIQGPLDLLVDHHLPEDIFSHATVKIPESLSVLTIARNCGMDILSSICSVRIQNIRMDKILEVLAHACLDSARFHTSLVSTMILVLTPSKMIIATG